MFADLIAGPIEFVGKWHFFDNLLTLHVSLSFGATFTNMV